MFITRIYQPAIALEEHGRAEVFFGVPPVRGAGGGAAGAKDAFVEPVQLLAIGWRHAVFFALRFYQSSAFEGKGYLREETDNIHLLSSSPAEDRA